MNDETIGTGKGWPINATSYDYLVIPRKGGAFGAPWGVVALSPKEAAEKAFRYVSSDPTSVVVVRLPHVYDDQQVVHEFEKVEELRTVIRERF
jgi:hypothetical protein